MRFALLLATALLAVTGCTPSGDSGLHLEPPANTGITPRLTNGSDGDLHLSWQEEISNDVTALRFATLTSNGWSQALEVSRGTAWFVNWADFPAVNQLGAKTWVAHWRVREPNGIRIEHSSSADGRTWSSPAGVTGPGSEQGFASVFNAAGVPHIVWIDTERDSSSLRSMAVNGNHSQPVDDSVCDCCQPGMVASPPGSLLVYRGRTQDEIRDIQIRRRTHQGWSAALKVADDSWQINGCPINGPAVATDGTVVAVAWYTEADFQPRVLLATAGNDLIFSKPKTVNLDRPLGRTGIAFAADGSAVVSYLRHADAGYSEFCVRRLLNGEWSPVQVVARFQSQGPGFPQLASWNGRIVAAWSHQGRLFTRYISFD